MLHSCEKADNTSVHPPPSALVALLKPCCMHTTWPLFLAFQRYYFVSTKLPQFVSFHSRNTFVRINSRNKGDSAVTCTRRNTTPHICFYCLATIQASAETHIYTPIRSAFHLIQVRFCGSNMIREVLTTLGRNRSAVKVQL